ncbi:nuclear transport factor 2 family protein [Blastococcus sp. SYSU DS0617]
MHEEPSRVTDPALAAVRNELAAREPLFHHPELGTSAEELDRQAAAEFEEVGASGRRYSREFVLATVRERHERGGTDDPWETGDFHCLPVGPETYLLTYDLRQGSRLTRRATIWRRTADDWEVVYHQGTLVS